MELKTSLYEKHLEHGGKIVPFAGYLLPVQFSGIIAEHMAVRGKVGLFDVSHMGEIVFEGKEALLCINHIFSNDFTNMVDGQVRYSVMCNNNGGIVDDFIVYKYNNEKYMAVVNAANKQKDYEWIMKNQKGDVVITDISDNLSQLALQGPQSLSLLKKITDEKEIPSKYYYFADNVSVGGINCLLSQTGYTGELGFELYVKNEDAPKLWDMLLKEGAEFGIVPCGLGARDTLRLEASMPLYGHEMSDDISPLEAGLGFAVKMKKDDFIGKKALEAKGEPQKKRVGIEIIGRGIVRENEIIFSEGKEIGVTTSGTHLPYLKKAMAMGYVEKDYSVIGTLLEIEVRGRKIEAKIVEMPFYKKA